MFLSKLFLSISFLNLVLRSLGLIARLGLVAYLTYKFGLGVVGIFGIIVAIVSIGPSVLSLGLHYRFNRAAVEFSSNELVQRLSDRLIIYIGVFAVFAPIFYYLFLIVAPFELKSSQVIWLLLLIIFLEAFAVELGLVLVSTKRALLANFFLFIRNSLWVFPFVWCSYFFDAIHGIQDLLAFWVLGLILSYCVLFFYLRNLPWKKVILTGDGLKWFFQGYGISLMILFSDIGLISGQFVDRAILGKLLTIEDVGIYTFFWSVANGVQVLVQAAVIQPSFPRLVMSAKSLGVDGVYREFKLIFMKVVSVGAPLAILIAIFCYLVVPYLERATLDSHLYVLPVLLLGILFRLFSDVVNYGLYALHLDKLLALINVCSVFFMVGYSVLFISIFGLVGACLAIIFSAITSLILRFFSLRRREKI